MATQKAALVGCKEGPWVSTSNMRNLRLHAKVPAGTKLRVLQREKNHTVCYDAEAGITKLDDFPWTKVLMLEGDPVSALCFLVSGNG